MTGLDLPLARLVGGPGGFPLRDNRLFETVLHSGLQGIAWVLLALMLLNIRYPFRFLGALSRRERVQLPLAILLGVLSVTLIKYWSRTSCPWDLAEFGGVLPYVSHWDLALSDGGGGHCFPGSHASTGFSFIAAYFVLRRHDTRIAALWLASSLVAGLVMGLSQQLRGAHFMSHTLWAAWVCWTVGGLVDFIAHRRARRVEA